MPNQISTEIVTVSAEWQPLKDASEVLQEVELAALASNAGDISFRRAGTTGDGGVLPPGATSSKYIEVDVSEIEVKGSPGDKVMYDGSMQK